MRKRREARQAHAKTWHEGDEDALHSRLGELHGDVSDISLPGDAGAVSRTHAALKRHHSTKEALLKRVREKAAEYSWLLQDEGTSPVRKDKARRLLAGLAEKYHRLPSELLTLTPGQFYFNLKVAALDLETPLQRERGPRAPDDPSLTSLLARLKQGAA